MQQVKEMARPTQMTAAELHTLIQQYGGIAPAARALGIPIGTLTSRASRWQIRSRCKGGK